MTKIEIVCGTYGYRPDGSLHPIPVSRGGTCIVSEEEADRLVSLGVAKVIESVPEAVATPQEDDTEASAYADMPAVDVSALCGSVVLDPDQLRALTVKDLRKLAGDMGCDLTGLRTKAQLIAAITAVEVEPGPEDDGEEPPDIRAEAPVV